jgi:hypothetical protein
MRTPLYYKINFCPTAEKKGDVIQRLPLAPRILFGKRTSFNKFFGREITVACSDKVERRHAIILPIPGSDCDRNREKILRDFERIQMFSIGHGGREDKEKHALIFTFEPEEYNCVLRYLNKFQWKDIESVPTIKKDFPLQMEID